MAMSISLSTDYVKIFRLGIFGVKNEDGRQHRTVLTPNMFPLGCLVSLRQ
jgi:hypothetical protein